MKALVVDLDEDYLETMRDILSRKGIDTRVSSDIRDALKILNRENFDVVITETYYPKKFLEEILKIAKGRGCITIATSTINSNGLKFDFVLEKPFDLDSLERILSRIFKRVEVKAFI